MEEVSELKNVTIIKSGQHEIALESLEDMLIVHTDKFKTGFECSKCDGECYLDEPCDRCNGTGREGEGETEQLCRFCCPKHLQQSMGCRPGKKLCDKCDGKGGTIILPDTSKQRVSSGVIKSVGPKVLGLKVGDRVLHSFFAGTEISMKQKMLLRIMHEHEVMCKIYGTSKFDEFVEL